MTSANNDSRVDDAGWVVDTGTDLDQWPVGTVLLRVTAAGSMSYWVRGSTPERLVLEPRYRARPTFDLKPHHLEALVFLQRHPGDEIGVIETEEQFAAAIVFSDLIGAGFVTGTLRPGGGGCRLTIRGEFAIAELAVMQ
jgi:hypothetical protein